MTDVEFALLVKLQPVTVTFLSNEIRSIHEEIDDIARTFCALATSERAAMALTMANNPW